MDNLNSEVLKKWIDNYDNYEETKRICDTLTYSIPKEL